MSKKVEASITCANCRTSFHVELFRTIWLESPENRKLVFGDALNVFRCAHCGQEVRVQFPVLATNAPAHFAVWYEPYADSQIDLNSEGYTLAFGEGNYLASAPRIENWEAFKEVITEFESGRRKGKPASQTNLQANFGTKVTLDKTKKKSLMDIFRGKR